MKLIIFLMHCRNSSNIGVSRHVTHVVLWLRMKVVMPNLPTIAFLLFILFFCDKYVSDSNLRNRLCILPYFIATHIFGSINLRSNYSEVQKINCELLRIFFFVKIPGFQIKVTEI